MKSITLAAATAKAFTRRHLPGRRIVVVSHGGERAVEIGTGSQLMGIAGAAVVAGWMTVATAHMTDDSTARALSAKQAELARMEAQVTALRADSAALQGKVVTTAQRIEARQAFLASLLTGKGKAVDLGALGEDDRVTGGRSVASRASAAVSGVLAPFARLERQQTAFVGKATATAAARLQDAQGVITRLGLSATRFLPQTAIGGPYVPAGLSADPKFADLFVSWKRVEQLETAMAALPSYMPIKDFRYTSSFGVRYDPFHGGAAMHTGLDMAGARGEPIYASADGIVARATWAGGYGNCVDVDHGKGIGTRYGHLSAILVQDGMRVKRGQLIGRMGSTGRSTGNHLHFEVRVDGRAVNPKPFLDAMNYVLAVQGRAGQMGPDLASVETSSAD